MLLSLSTCCFISATRLSRLFAWLYHIQVLSLLSSKSGLIKILESQNSTGKENREIRERLGNWQRTFTRSTCRKGKSTTGRESVQVRTEKWQEWDVEETRGKSCEVGSQHWGAETTHGTSVRLCTHPALRNMLCLSLELHLRVATEKTSLSQALLWGKQDPENFSAGLRNG